MPFKIEIETGNESFDDDAYGSEIARLLRLVTERLAQGYEAGTLRDVNGNTVGSWIGT